MVGLCVKKRFSYRKANSTHRIYLTYLQYPYDIVWFQSRNVKHDCFHQYCLSAKFPFFSPKAQNKTTTLPKLRSNKKNTPKKNTKFVEEHLPSDSKWPFYPLVGGYLTFPKGHLAIPKRSQRIARSWTFFSASFRRFRCFFNSLGEGGSLSTASRGFSTAFRFDFFVGDDFDFFVGDPIFNFLRSLPGGIGKTCERWFFP